MYNILCVIYYIQCLIFQILKFVWQLDFAQTRWRSLQISAWLSSWIEGKGQGGGKRREKPFIAKSCVRC